MSDPKKTDPQKDAEKTDPSSGSPQQQTKDPQDHSAKWPGGGKKGEDEP